MPSKKSSEASNDSASASPNGRTEVKKHYLIIDEVLMYANQHRHSSTRDNLVKVLSCSFTLEEVVKAKDKLITELDELILSDRKKNRKDSQNRSEKMKVCEDIIDALSDIDEHGEVELVCAAVRWAKIPKIDPESISDVSVAEKLVQLEAKFSILESSLSEIKAHQVAMEDRKMSEPKKVSGKPTSSVSGSSAKPLLSEIVARGSGGSQQMATTGTSDKSLVQKPAENLSSGSEKLSNVHDDGFRISSEQRKKQVRKEQTARNTKRNRVHVSGSAKNAKGLRSTPRPNRDFFVYRVHKDDGEKQLHEYLTGKNIEVVNLEKISHEDAKFNSFHLSISIDYAATVLDSNFWPSGINIRKWTTRKETDETTDENRLRLN